MAAPTPGNTFTITSGIRASPTYLLHQGKSFSSTLSPNFSLCLTGQNCTIRPSKRKGDWESEDWAVLGSIGDRIRGKEVQDRRHVCQAAASAPSLFSNLFPRRAGSQRPHAGSRTLIDCSFSLSRAASGPWVHTLPQHGLGVCLWKQGQCFLEGG